MSDAGMIRGLYSLLVTQAVGLVILAFSAGYAAHRDGPLSPFVLAEGLITGIMLAMMVVTVRRLLLLVRLRELETLLVATCDAEDEA